ncbi:hypothetical protein J5N97_025863 [Dioscorea zingiberensis]|uniref:Uncharacterized protein n=1 Tax=Dioscorea zingiberensis TaxID=325984 RepID=A0A9D5H677_9LILI|nr:hypothetical protein J5N97_025863 [Dioscorea zingiberensis]
MIHQGVEKVDTDIESGKVTVKGSCEDYSSVVKVHMHWENCEHDLKWKLLKLKELKRGWQIVQNSWNPWPCCTQSSNFFLPLVLTRKIHFLWYCQQNAENGTSSETCDVGRTSRVRG